MLFCCAARGLALDAVKYANRATRFAAKAPMIAKFQATQLSDPPLILRRALDENLLSLECRALNLAYYDDAFCLVEVTRGSAHVFYMH